MIFHYHDRSLLIIVVVEYRNNKAKPLFSYNNGERASVFTALSERTFEGIAKSNRLSECENNCSFTKEMLTFQVAERRGSRDQYVDGLVDVINLISNVGEPMVIHTDQGSVYSSKAYNDLIKDANVVRPMSRAGKPTDNPVNEALNGWIKEELVIDFQVERCRSREEFRTVMQNYQRYYNHQRPCYAINYNTPDGYR